MPWLLSVPLLLGILPSITLAGIPDREADALASKRTLAVRLGRAGALWVALVFTLLAAAAAVAGQLLGLADGALPVSLGRSSPTPCCWRGSCAGTSGLTQHPAVSMD